MRKAGIVCVAALLFVGCNKQNKDAGSVSYGSTSDIEQVRGSDISILFVGNSHTSFHNLPNFVRDLILSRQPNKKVYCHVISVAFLEDVARDARCKDEIDTRPWKHVVLQGQKISMSGKVEYSRSEGIDIAKRAKARGARVHFYSEWGLKNVAGDGERNEKIYRDMAKEADVNVVPIGRAWDVALAERPELALHAPDGNHQSELGAFLTACVLAGHLTGDDPTTLASFAYRDYTEEDRRFLAESAAKALKPTSPDPEKR